MRFEVVTLALTASIFTALASLAQRNAAAPAPQRNRPSLRLIGYLMQRPVWFVGIGCMILGFVFQIAALRMGSLSLVQPIIATELVIVFVVIALRSHRSVHTLDWLAAFGMAAALGVFLTLARPSGGHDHASGSMWVLSGISILAVAVVLVLMAYGPKIHGVHPSSARKAALFGIAAATGFGYVAAVIKELSTHLAQGPVAVFTNWSPYVLILSGAVSMFLASHAFQAGSLAASQPGLTIVDPLVASVLGVVLFGERLDFAPLALVGELVAFAVLVSSVVLLSRSPLVRDENPSSISGTIAVDSADGIVGRGRPVYVSPVGRHGLESLSPLSRNGISRRVPDAGDSRRSSILSRSSR
jgi:drug/metabolite transporter (DMT)-like permease